MAKLMSLTSDIVRAHASNTQMTSDELYQELENVYATLKALESGTSAGVTEQPKQLTIRLAFKKDEVICMICGKGYKTLKRHIAQAHDLKPGQYRKQFGIPSTQSLVAKSYSESRRQTAIDKGLGEGLAKARKLRAAQKAAAPVLKSKSSAPAVKSVPAIKKKAAAPAKIEKSTASVKATKSVSRKASTKSKP